MVMPTSHNPPKDPLDPFDTVSSLAPFGGGQNLQQNGRHTQTGPATMPQGSLPPAPIATPPTTSPAATPSSTPTTFPLSSEKSGVAQLQTESALHPIETVADEEKIENDIKEKTRKLQELLAQIRKPEATRSQEIKEIEPAPETLATENTQQPVTPQTQDDQSSQLTSQSQNIAVVDKTKEKTKLHKIEHTADKLTSIADQEEEEFIEKVEEIHEHR